MSAEMRKKVKSKADIGKVEMNTLDLFGGGLRIPANIQKELDERGLVGRFVSLKTLTATGGHHPRGWTVYQIQNPEPNPISGNIEKVYKYGDLVLAAKPAAAHAQHKAFLASRSEAQSKSHKNNVKEMRDRIKDSRADKHISLIEGYEENGDDE